MRLNVGNWSVGTEGREWETREGRRTIIILHMKKRKLEPFNKASTQPCVLRSQEEGTVKPKIKKGEETNFWPPLNRSSYCRLAITKPIYACSQDMLFHGQYLICSQTNAHKHPDFPQYVARFLVSRFVTHQKMQPTNPFPSHPRFQRLLDAKGRTNHSHSLCNTDQRTPVGTS